MKVLHVTNTYPTSSLPLYGIFVKEQIDSLKAKGIDCDVFFINGREKGKAEYLRSYFRLRRIINEYDIIHVHHFLSAVVVSALKHKRVVVSYLSDGIKEFIGLPDNYFFNRIIRQSLYDYVNRNTKAKIFKKQIPQDFINDSLAYHLPNGVNLNIFKPINREDAKSALGLSPDKRYILFSSLISLKRKEKRYDKFLETISILQNKYNQKDIEPLVMENVERSKVPLYINASELHLLTSDFEGSPNSVKECLACNVPVVSTNVGNVPDLIEGLKHSFVAEKNTSEELAELANKVLQNNQQEDSRSLLINKALDVDSKAIELKAIYELMMK